MIINQLFDAIVEGSTLTIGGSTHRVVAKARYVTEKQPNKWYAKVFMTGAYVLVISPSDSFVAFGKDIESIDLQEPFSTTIEFNGKWYIQVDADYQILVHLEFGDPIDTEAEVRFWDYQAIDDPGSIISLGRVTRTGHRADFVGHIIAPDEVAFSQSLR